MHLGYILSLAASLVIAVAILASCASTRPVNSVSATTYPDQEVHAEIPQDSWEPIFFREIDKRTATAKLPRLRSMVFPKNDFEARFWIDTSYFGMDGIVVRRIAGVWSGTYIHGFSREPNFKQFDEPLQPPRSGWDAAWQRFVEAGLLTMPDASQVGCKVGGLDGIGFVIETNVERKYRTYMYDNPEFAKCDQAKQMLNLIDTISQEFGLKWSATK